MKKLVLAAALFAGMGFGFANEVKQSEAKKTPTENLEKRGLKENTEVKVFRFDSKQKALDFIENKFKLCHEVRSWFTYETSLGVNGEMYEVLTWHVQSWYYIC